MFCPRCGAQVAAGAAFCGACGSPMESAGAPPVVGGALKRPGIVSLLAILQFLGAAFWLLPLLAIPALPFGNAGSAIAGFLLVSIVALQIACGIGLWRLKPYGRTIQLVFAWIGLIGFPIGTLISILILVYLFKPGIKVLFSGKSASEMTAEELGQAAAVGQGSAAAVIIVVAVVAVGGVFFIGIIAAIAVPGLLRARMAGNEASAIGSLRAINSAEAAYSPSCAGGGYAVALEDLAKPPTGSSVGFVSPELGTTGVVRSGYRFTLAKNAAPGVTDVGTAAATCNGSASTPASGYFALAEPITAGGTGIRYFVTDQRGTIYSSETPISNPIVETTLTPIQ